MNAWAIVTCVLLGCLALCAVGVLRGTPADRLVALEAATVVVTLALLTFEQAEQRQSFFDLSVAMAVLAVPSSLLFARVYRRWLP